MPEFPERPPIADAPKSIVLVAHNAQAHLEAVILGWLSALAEMKSDFEILLVDDGSSDGTADRAEQLAAKERRLRVLRQTGRLGFGAALRTALAEAKHPLLFHAPCQPRYTPAHLQKLLAHIDPADIVIGYRAGRPMPTLYRCLGFCWRALLRILPGVTLDPRPGWLGGQATRHGWLVRLVFGVRVGDVESPIKLFRRSVFQRIPIQSAGPFAHTEIIAKANFLDCLLDEVPLDILPEWEAADNRLAEGWQVFQEPTFRVGLAVAQGTSCGEE